MPVRFRVSWPGSEDSRKATERSRLVKKILALAGVIGLSLAGSASGAVTLSALDKHYIQNSAKGDHFEITGGKLAAARGTNPKIKALGSRLEKDHSKSLKELRGLGKALHVSIPKSPTHSQTWEIGQVKGLSGRAFDRAYASLEVADHRDDIEEASEEAKSGTNSTVRASARKELPTLRLHLKLAKAALKAVG
jgi:putative membrane protein